MVMMLHWSHAALSGHGKMCYFSLGGYSASFATTRCGHARPSLLKVGSDLFGTPTSPLFLPGNHDVSWVVRTQICLVPVRKSRSHHTSAPQLGTNRRMASDEPGPGQRCALQARKHIATLRRARPGIAIESRWCPALKGVAGNEKADEWAKIAAGEPNTRGVEWLSSLGQTEVRAASLPRSLANLKREISEKKWAEARQWAGGRISKKKYRLPESRRPDGAVAGSTKRLASRFYQLKTGHCLTGQYLNWTKSRPTPQCLVPVPNADPGPPLQGVPLVEAAAEDPVGGGEEGDWEMEGSVEGAGPTGRREVQPGGAGLPLDHGRGKAGAGGGGG